VLACFGISRTFVAPSPNGVTAPALRATAASRPDGQAAGHSSSALGVAAGVALGLAAAAGLASRRQSKTAARYTTAQILPALTWVKSGVKLSDLEPTQLIAKQLAGNDVLIGKDESGELFCVSNLCPHIATPLSEGADVIGDVIVCPLHGSSFSVKTGELIDWCPSPPIIGPLTGLIVEKKKLLILDARSSFFGGDIEVLVDINAKKAYEADYWKGVLDAQGKDDGTYY